MSFPTDARENLIQAAIQGTKAYAYVRYSKFRVGAALLCADGTIIKGCNVENASYGGAICAERTAIVKAISEGKKDFVAMAVTTDVPTTIAPCGICRQVLREFCALDTPVLLVPADYPQEPSDAGSEGYLASTEGGVVAETVGSLLPASFGPEELERPRLPAELHGK
ncbi:cytidine deaminase [Chiua virens]|nr:cytidine deaminase [Chiua virens]